MKKFLLPALFMCLYAGASAAETPKKSTDANLFGHVVDRETHEHLPYATVAVTGTAFGATTDASGHYFLKNLPEGELTLEVRALGYAVLAKKVTLERGQTLELNFEVVQSGISMDEVVVSASRSATARSSNVPTTNNCCPTRESSRSSAVPAMTCFTASDSASVPVISTR